MEILPTLLLLYQCASWSSVFIFHFNVQSKFRILIDFLFASLIDIFEFEIFSFIFAIVGQISR